MKKTLLHLGVFLLSVFGLYAQTSSTGKIMLESTSGQAIQLDLDQSTGLVTMTFDGPENMWFAVGFNAGSMIAGTDIVYIKEEELIDAHLVGFSPPVTDGSNDWTLVSNNVSGNLRTIVATRAINSSDNADDYDFDGNSIPLIWAQGVINADGTIARHTGSGRGPSFAEFTRTSPPIDGGTIAGGPFEFTVGDGIADNIEEGAITLEGNSGSDFSWIITDDQGNILGLPATPYVVDFDGAGVGTCFVWHLSSEGTIEGLEEGLSVANLKGSFDLSNFIAVTRTEVVAPPVVVDGGNVSTSDNKTEVTTITGDGIADVINFGTTSDSSESYNYLITDEVGKILAVETTLHDFEGASVGICLVYGISFQGNLTVSGKNIADTGLASEAFDVSDNWITVTRTAVVVPPPVVVDGGTITGGPFEFTVGDGIADNIEEGAIVLEGNSGSDSKWIITDDKGNILGLPPTPYVVDFDGAGVGTCLVWHLSSEGVVEGLEEGKNAADLEGDFDLSNSISVVRNAVVTPPVVVDGGTITGGPFEFTVGDGIADNIEEGAIVLEGNSGSDSKWIITDDKGNILGLPPTPYVVDFDGAGVGTCLVWHLSSEGVVEGLEEGKNAADLKGTFDLSNSISVIRNADVTPPTPVDGGAISGGPFEFTVGDGIPDMVSGIDLIGNEGTNSQWVITDDKGVILGLPKTLANVESNDFDNTRAGVCLIWHLSHENDLTGAKAGNNTNQLKGTFHLSNSISVTRVAVIVPPTGDGHAIAGKIEAEDFDMQSGIISIATTDTGGGQNIGFIENGDYTEYNVTVNKTGKYAVDIRVASATNGGTIVLKLNGAQIGEVTVPGTSGWQTWETISTMVDLDAGSQVLRLDFVGDAGYLFNVNYMNFTLPTSSTIVDGGTITGGPFEFTVGDGIADNIEEGAIALEGNSGANSQWVVTDDKGNILGLPPTPYVVDFDGAGVGTCLLWHLSSKGVVEGLEEGKNAADLEGDFDLSNSIEVVRNAVVTPPDTGCTFGAPTATPLESTYSFYRYAHVLGSNGPDLSSLRAFSFIWNLEQNKLWRVGLLTKKENSRYGNYTNLAKTATHKLNEAQPEVTFSNTGIEKFDGSYYVAKDGRNIVLVSKNGGFTIYFSRSKTAPECDGNQGKKSSNLDIDLVISPNPTNGIINISGIEALTSGKVEVFSLTGQRLKSIDISSNPNITLDLSEFQAGIYMVRVFSLEKSTAQRIILN